jgi:oxygen-independent coproporphyrinogen-3 oxidase
MREEIIRRYGRLPAPRYTSYPTAVDFSPAIGPAEKARWLERLDANAPASLYLHVPYCRDICFYCGCATKMALRDHVLDEYRRALENEIDLVARHFSRPPRVSHVHWGGGTPSILGAEGLSRTFAALARHFRFEPGFEHAIELDPRFVTPQLAQGLARLGVNRASLGVQDLDARVQIAIGRVQPLARIEAAFEALRAAGISRLNVDLIYGLPQQTTESVAATAEQVIALSPDRVAAYGYAHLPAARPTQRRIENSQLPDVCERYAQAQVLGELFTKSGYETIGMDHFAKPDDGLAAARREARLRRNFQGYTDDGGDELIGFGASAISCLSRGFVQNTANPTDYIAALNEGRLPVTRGHRLTEDDRLRAGVIGELMCDFVTDLKLHAPPGAFSDELALLRPMTADGLVTIVNERVAMTPLGRPFVRVAAAVFDAFPSRRAATPFSAAL